MGRWAEWLRTKMQKQCYFAEGGSPQPALLPQERGLIRPPKRLLGLKQDDLAAAASTLHKAPGSHLTKISQEFCPQTASSPLRQSE